MWSEKPVGWLMLAQIETADRAVRWGEKEHSGGRIAVSNFNKAFVQGS